MNDNRGTGRNQLTLWPNATRRLKQIEGAVRRFSRYNKYSLGSDLRRQAMTVWRLIFRAWHARDDWARPLDRLMLAVDDLKLLIQSGKELGAFASFAEFQGIAEAAVTLGRQSGGRRWAGQPPSPPPASEAT